MSAGAAPVVAEAEAALGPGGPVAPDGSAHLAAAFDVAGLAATAEVIVHGYRPGALAALGYRTAALRRLAPGVGSRFRCRPMATAIHGPGGAALTAWCR